MAREIVISSYLFIIRLFFKLFSKNDLEEKTVLIASFGDNINYVRRACLNETKHKLIILTTNSTKEQFMQTDRQQVFKFETLHLIQFILSLYHIATAKVVFVDNYFGFLAAIEFRKEVKVVQLWHAAGAIKKFGLEDPSVKYRSKGAKIRFQNVYSRFTHVVVGSDKMATIFKKSFGVTDEQIIFTGIPRTDFFFDNINLKLTKDALIKKFPSISGKKVIMYAPTFRDSEISNFKLNLDIDKMRVALIDTHILLLRLHPVVWNKTSFDNDPFVINVSNYPRLNDLLCITDCLITDYSSIPFEFALLNRPMIFFSYDLNEYKRERGFWFDYIKFAPGPVVDSTDGIVNILTSHIFDYDSIKNFSSEWNQHSKGCSSNNLVEFIYSNDFN